MKYRKFRIALSKGWTLIVCSFSVMILALTGSCKSKKVTKTDQSEEIGEVPAEEVVDEYTSSIENTLSPMLIMPDDSKEVKEMINQVNNLKKELSGRMNSVIYGTPEVMERRARENRAMRAEIDSLDNEINKARQKK
jgi:SMC interacting uncharacterized protein involved in chromosome segregation